MLPVFDIVLPGVTIGHPLKPSRAEGPSRHFLAVLQWRDSVGGLHGDEKKGCKDQAPHEGSREA